jgi:hypothetical protein
MLPKITPSETENPAMWTAEKILALAPDPASAKAAQSLTSPRKWVTSGKNDRALWGECQGSGSKPYQTQIDLAEPAFKCSCPSRKFPCKHGLALFLMLGPTAPAADAPPQWVTDWLTSRSEKAQKKQEKIEKAAAEPPDPAAQQERLAERWKNITAGAQDLSLFLEDLLRQGLAAARTNDKPFAQQAARLVDAQAPGLARLLREAAGTLTSGPGWERRTLARLAQLHLLLQALQRFDKLPPLLQSELRSLVGIPLKEDELAAAGGQPLADTFLVLGQRTDTEDNLRAQRTWLLGQSSGRHALILEFAFGAAPLKSTLAPGTAFSGSLLFYPSFHPLRATITSRHPTNFHFPLTTDPTTPKPTASTPRAQTNAPPAPAPSPQPAPSHPNTQNSEPSTQDSAPYPTISSMQTAHANALAQNPFLPTFPATLTHLRPLHRDTTLAIDSQNHILPLSPLPGHAWRIIALSGGHPITLFGEFDGHSLTPFSLLVEDTLHALT